MHRKQQHLRATASSERASTSWAHNPIWTLLCYLTSFQISLALKMKLLLRHFTLNLSSHLKCWKNHRAQNFWRRSLENDCITPRSNSENHAATYKTLVIRFSFVNTSVLQEGRKEGKLGSTLSALTAHTEFQFIRAVSEGNKHKIANPSCPICNQCLESSGCVDVIVGGEIPNIRWPLTAWCQVKC